MNERVTLVCEKAGHDDGEGMYWLKENCPWCRAEAAERRIQELESEREEAKPVLEAARAQAEALKPYELAVADPQWPTRLPGLFLQVEPEVVGIVSTNNAIRAYDAARAAGEEKKS